MTRIIALSVPKVKSHRNTSRKPGRFAAGLMAYTPTYRVEHSEADRVWWAARNGAEPDWDAMAAESEGQGRVEAGTVL
jgi:hypothetical protein